MWPFKKRAADNNNNADRSLDDLLLEAFLGGGELTRDEAMQIPAFAGCVNKICDTIAIIPIILYRKDKDGNTEEIKDDDRTKLINVDTGDTLDGPDFKRAIVYDYLTNKGGYAYVHRVGQTFKGIYYVDADRVSFREGVDPIFKDFKMLVDGAEYDAHHFLRVLRRTKNGAYGSAVIKESKLAVAVPYTALKFEDKLAKRGGNRKGFLESEKKLDQPAIDYLKEAFNKLYQEDKDNAIVLNDGVKFHESSNSPTELQLNENKKANSVEICKLFGMPPGILSGGATEKEWQQYIQYCIVPILESFTKALDRAMLLEKEKESIFFSYDISELTRADIKTRFEAYEKGYKNGFIQIDEIRQLEKLPDLNIPFFKMGLQDVLYNPATGDIFMPNMNAWANTEDPNKFPSADGSALPGSRKGSQKTPKQPKEETEEEPGKEKTEDEGKDQSGLSGD